MNAQGPQHRPTAQDFSRTDAESEPQHARHFSADLIMALRFYSRLPTGASAHERPDLNRIAWALPVANLLIGALPATLLVLLAWLGAPSLFAATLAAAGLVLVSGAMSEDALADAADGLFGGTTRQHRLEIMRDSRHGSYGVLAIVFLVALRVMALAAIIAVSPVGGALCWLAATGLARSASLWPAHALPSARSDGAAADAGALRRTAFLGGMALSALLAIGLAGPFAAWTGLVVAVPVTVAVVMVWTFLCDRLAGGVTGDLIGALQALVEIALLTAFMLAIIRA